jgi:oligopeptide transport system ATP-binding protein
VPNPLRLPSGCAFHPRCKYAQDGRCNTEVPVLVDSGAGHMVRCVRWEEIKSGTAAEVRA